MDAAGDGFRQRLGGTAPYAPAPECRTILPARAETMTQEDEFEDEDEDADVEDVDVDDADLEDEEDLDEDALDDDVELADDAAEVPVDAPVEVPSGTKPRSGETTREGGDEEEEDVLDLDEELHPDDVEAPLDALLQERTAKATLEDEEEEVEEEEPDGDPASDGPTKIVPRRPGEFLCSSCFLVLPRNQLADERRMLCRDCA